MLSMNCSLKGTAAGVWFSRMSTSSKSYCITTVRIEPPQPVSARADCYSISHGENKGAGPIRTVELDCPACCRQQCDSLFPALSPTRFLRDFRLQAITVHATNIRVPNSLVRVCTRLLGHTPLGARLWRRHQQIDNINCVIVLPLCSKTEPKVTYS